MSTPLADVGAITLFVADVERAKSWYQRTFDRPVVFEDASSAVIKFDNTLVNLLLVAEAHALIAPAPVAAGAVGATAQFTIWVDDADATCAELRERGVTLINGPQDREWVNAPPASPTPTGTSGRSPRP